MGFVFRLIFERVDVLKKMITFEDLEGNEVTEEFYFHLSQAELVKMQLSHGGNLEEYFRRILKEQDSEAIISAFDEIILATVGERSPDGKRFIKDNGRVAQAFKETDAYSVLFTELLSNDGKNLQAFFSAAVPTKVRAEVEKNLRLQDRIGIAAERIQGGDEALREHLRIRVEEIAAEKMTEGDMKEEIADSGLPRWLIEDREPTREEFLAMTPEDFVRYRKA